MGFKNQLCFYCGDPAQAMDHVWPKIQVGELTDKVPACTQCNSRLGAKRFNDKWEKKQYIANCLQDDYDAGRGKKSWSEVEILAMGEHIRKNIREGSHKLNDLEKRLRWARYFGVHTCGPSSAKGGEANKGIRQRKHKRAKWRSMMKKGGRGGKRNGAGRKVHQWKTGAVPLSEKLYVRLTPGQKRNLERVAALKAMNPSRLIQDMFDAV